MKDVHVAVTGAAGQISYNLLFRLASGEAFGESTRVHLHLLELPQAIKAAEGVALELQDCAFKTLGSVNCDHNAEACFSSADWAILVGAAPRGPGMERADLIRKNGPIFVSQGKALNRANSNVKVLVIGNPCNTNALIAQSAAKDIPGKQFMAMTTLDENRARAQLAIKSKAKVEEIQDLFIWGNHSPTMYPDFENARISSQKVDKLIEDESWLKNNFLKLVQQRGADIIKARGSSSAASAASACIDQIKYLQTPGKRFSCVVLSDGSQYDIPKGLMFSFPVKTNTDGSCEIIKDISLSEFSQSKIQTSTRELLKEKELVKDLLN
jgi:malate dehydrogenase